MSARERVVEVIAETLHSISCADDECDGGDMGSYESDAAAVVEALRIEMGLREERRAAFAVLGIGSHDDHLASRLTTDWQEDEG